MRVLLVLLMLLLATTPGVFADVRAPRPPLPALTLSGTQLDWVGQQVFRNECNARQACLVHWNRGEGFPSLGIGHFIWYPEEQSGPFVESFPALVDYMQAQRGDLPDWLVAQAPLGAPWRNREAFLAADQGHDPRIHQLRTLLAQRQGTQVAFLVERARGALLEVVAASRAPAISRRKIHALAGTPGGVYALIDYVNFKGEGLAETERYGGVGWGLLQVLESMPDDASLQKGTELAAFREAAARVLIRRAERADRSIEREQWLRGWLKRVDSYREPGANGT